MMNLRSPFLPHITALTTLAALFAGCLSTSAPDVFSSRTAATPIRDGSPEATNTTIRVSLRCERPMGLYTNLGETARFQLRVIAPANADTTKVVRVTSRYPGTVTNEVFDLPLSPATASETELAFTPRQPGWVFVKANVVNAKGQNAGPSDSAGAMVAPQDIRPGAPVPADFDAFWDKNLAELRALPIEATVSNVTLTAEQSQGGKIRAFEFSVNCLGPRPATGMVSMPANAKPKSLPIIVIYQGASAIRANLGLYYGDVAIFAVVGKFGLPNQPSNQELMKQYGKTDIERWPWRDIENRDNAFRKWMILRNLRAQQYLKTLPEWDGRTLLVNGESMGGAQSLIGGALDPDVTFICACVPALCDHGGQYALRHSGWPGLWKAKGDGTPKDEAEAAIAASAPYFDTANFIHRIKVETTIGTGLLDSTCPPESVWAAQNLLAPAVADPIWWNPRAGHGAGNLHGGRRIEEILGK
jgi:cephalosporin-C deacetylase-like acetyl esterase